MIHVDEKEPVGEIQQSFPPRDVVIKRGVNAKEIYEMVTEIGRGKFGTVYKCQEKATGLQLAAKFVPIPKRDDRRNVEREVELMNALQHTLIIQLYDALEYQKMMCVVLELVEGGELFDRVIDDDFVLSERACAVFIRQVCQAMEFVHRNSIIHLDLKPENIMCLTREGNRIKIIDFGLARKYDPDKKLQVLFGTPEFVAPEVVNFDQISFGTDMWSVGVICYVLLSGLSPFMGSTDIETMANVTIGKYDFDDEAFNDVSKEALDFIRKLLVKDTCTRFTASQCLEHKWLKRRKGSKLGKFKTKANGKLKNSKIPLSPTADNIPQERQSGGDPVANGQPLELLLLNVDDTENNNHMVLNKNDAHNQHNGHNENEELTATKDNLKSFIERWEEHPNSPYVFDTDANRISPVTVCGLADAAHPKRLNGGSANSGLSSRDRSPSPCDSLSCEPYQSSATSDPIPISPTRPAAFVLPCPPAVLRQRSEFFDSPKSNHTIRDSLPTIERRNSDTDCVLDRQSIYEKVNLADEIKKLSDRLMKLSSMNTELEDENVSQISHQNGLDTDKLDYQPTAAVDTNPKPMKAPKPNTNPKADIKERVREKPTVTEDSGFSRKPIISEKPEFLKNRTRSTMEEMFIKSINSNGNLTHRSNFQQSRTFIRASSVAHESRSFTENVFDNRPEKLGALGRINRVALFDRLQQLEDLPKLRPKLHKVPESNGFHTSNVPKTSDTSCDNTSKHINTPWASQFETSRRTKFRVSQMSRDVPIGSPDTHHTIFLEETVSTATTTKDCLRQLLDTYGDADRRTTDECSQTGRQSSLNASRSEEVEQRSVNSLNFFFQKHATMGNSVKQMQAQLESKRKA